MRAYRGAVLPCRLAVAPPTLICRLRTFQRASSTSFCVAMVSQSFVSGVVGFFLGGFGDSSIAGRDPMLMPYFLNRTAGSYGLPAAFHVSKCRCGPVWMP